MLFIDKNIEAVTAFFLKSNQKYIKCAVLQLKKFDENIYTKCIFCDNPINIMLVMVYTDF